MGGLSVGVNLGVSYTQAGGADVALTPQQLGFFKIRFAVTFANINLAAFNPSLYTYPVAGPGSVVLICGQTDPIENGPYVMGTGSPTCALSRHPDYALNSIQDATMVFRANDDGAWPMVDWKSFGGVGFTPGAQANSIVVGTDPNPIFPVSVPNFGDATLSNGVIALANIPLLMAAQNNAGVVGVFDYSVKTANNDALTVGYAITSVATAGISRTVTITAKLANGSTNTADNSVLSYKVSNV